MYNYRDLLGDHPLSSLESGVTDQGEIEAESLYIVDRQGKLHLARPLLIRQVCDKCGNWSTFSIDSYSSKENYIAMISMEHGHVFKDVDLVEAFRLVGLLV
jgi:hypothetical protein